MWASTRLYDINDNLIRTIECPYNKATSAVYHDNNIGEWFRATNGVHQACLLSPTLFNIFLERIMADALEDHEGTASILADALKDHEETVSVRDRTITDLRFADDINGLPRQERELIKLVYVVHVSAENTQLITNTTDDIRSCSAILVGQPTFGRIWKRPSLLTRSL